MLLILTWLVATVSLGYFTYFFTNGTVRKRLLLSFNVKTAGTPRRGSGLDTNTASAFYQDNTYASAFPPNRRHASRLLNSSPATQEDQSSDDLESRQALQLSPTTDTANQKKHLHHLTATGFSLRDILELGDFCDYATLSGIALPCAYHEFDIDKALPRPYRPFRWAYHQTMSMTRLEPDWWLELNRDYKATIAWRQQTFEKHGDAVLQTLPGSELAAKELMEMCLQFLCARYPHYFSLNTEDMMLHNEILGNKTDLRATPPMHVLLANVPEDFAIMLRDPTTGLYTFRGGMIMSSLGWSLGTKLGLTLDEIHKPVPDYQEKMQFSMNRYFSKMPTDKPIQRGSWGLEIDKPLFMPPEDPHCKLRQRQDPEHTIDRVHLRVDWQTLRRLPLSGAIVFNFKGLFTPVTEFRDEPYVPSLVLKVLKEGRKGLMEYKDTWHTEHVVVPYLEKCEREQVERGVIEEEWEARTLDEAPFFPGWEEKWERQQGF
ncbi:hypothetical protein Slin15195_G055040 [Septoria linicola]|uniref:Alpha-1,2-mannosyltransferase n=1 Tax=Septoria linicola TaxID=215465 RepID=A0A9Q9EIM5_9PEZI|nr:hypothetical protein Slin14017_G070900 [Septoria linicola]USW52185.1 hypothetical protein Slin15195_G055040 [Septoria linicola]